MTKQDIAERIQLQTGFSRKESIEALELVLSIMKNALASGEEIKVAGFGKFALKEKNDRRGRNPQTGETITINARRILTFKPSTLLRQSINSPPE